MNLRLIIAIFNMVVLLSSCNGNDHRLNAQKHLTGLKKDPKNVAQNNSSVLALPTPATYQEQKLRSPFDDSGTITNRKNSTSNPLRDYPLTALRFVGTIIHDSITNAYILSPDNKIYQIKVGNIIGEHDGIVEHIYPNRIEIKEKQYGDGMQPTYKIVTMQLKDKNND
jgi:Tfp pilus assembly protein PilP